MVDHCYMCLMSRKFNPHKLVYQLLESVHQPRQLVYLDILGPVTGIKSEYRYVLTMLNGFSRLLATRPIPNRQAKTVVAAVHDVFSREMGVPARVITDRGSEFVSADTRALLESQLVVKIVFIPAGEHQQNLVERAHRMLWGVIRAICVTKDATTWKTAVQEVTYQYNCTPHHLTGFSPNLLHHGYDEASPRLLHPEGVLPKPPPVTQADRIKFTTQVQQMKNLICGIIIKNQNEAHRRVAKYYLMRSLQILINSWVWVYNPQARPPEGDKIENRKLSVEWAGPCIFEGMVN